MSDVILLSHGNGGESTKRLISEIILKHLGNRGEKALYDAAVFNAEGRLAFTTDSFVISPVFFKGGDIGTLSVDGTCNDLGVMGAKPLYLSLAFIIEEGFRLSDLKKIVESIKNSAEYADVRIVTGDTKVVEKGKGDGIFINTSGIGVITPERDWRGRKIQNGDVVIISGTIGDHGTAVMLERLGVETTQKVKSDVAPAGLLALKLLDRFQSIKFVRDPTRGGVATVLNEVSEMYGIGIEVWEDELPLKDWVKEATEILGVDPLYIANEGKIVLIASKEEADEIIDFMRKDPLGRDAKIIGEVKDTSHNRVYLKTTIGTKRILDTLKKDILPRIC